MAGYIVTGKLGAGKGKFGVSKMAAAVMDGRRVATNFDLRLEHLVGPKNRNTVVRLPDRPTVADLEALGHGQPGEYDESRMGELHLDECASWLNARAFSDRGRAGLIDWFVHARKHGWQPFFYVQNMEMLDKQIRGAIADYCVKIIRADRVRIPIIGAFLGRFGRLPRVHIANYSMVDVPGIVVDRDMFRADDLHEAYDTRQVFREWARDPSDLRFADETYAGPFSYLSAWHLRGRFDASKARSGVFARLRRVPARPELKPKLPAVQLAAKLPPDEAMRWAGRYARYCP